ncbi:MAG: hypothetical protein HRT45_15320 [Bdellovibrionales bacterium]|nr:hypothetical protein [Bdellovibrionales bacterium]
MSETEPPTANWLQIQSRALSCAWQMSPTGSHDNSWMSWLDDFYSTERSGYNIDLSVAIKEGVGELELTESQLRAATAHWDHAVLNEVFSSKVNTKLDGLPAERVCLLMAEEFSQNQICEGHTLEGLGLQVVRDLAVEAVRSDAGFEPRLKKSFQLNSLIGQEVGSMLPVAGEVELVFESESLAEPHFMIESYSKIKAAEYEIKDSLRSTTIDNLLGVSAVSRLPEALLDWFESRLPSLGGVSFLDSVTRQSFHSRSSKLQHL